MTEQVADRLRPAYEGVQAGVHDSDMIYCDETSFPVDGDQHWVWTFVTNKVVLYTIEESRRSQVLEGVLGDELVEDATLSCDDWSMYPSHHGTLQRCWAHLLREATYVAKRHEEVESISEVLNDLRKVFDCARRRERVCLRSQSEARVSVIILGRPDQGEL